MRTMTVFVGKLNESFSVDVNNGSLEYLIQYGLNQSVNDAHASVTRKTHPVDADMMAATREKVTERLGQIESGNVPSLRGPAALTDETIAKNLGCTVEEVRAMRAKAVAAATPKAPESTLIQAGDKKGKKAA